VREHYGRAAASFQAEPSGCCGGSVDTTKLQTLYEAADVLDLPAEVSGLSMGCGDPITLASLQPGQTVLDLGSGGGIDCFLAAKRVGENGRVIGVDMTPAMIEKARANAQNMGFPNVEFRLGEIEHLPVSDQSVDVIISNCVINLSPDKQQVFHEAFRVLKPGGKMAVSDIVTDGPLPQPIKDSLEAWAGCMAGALDINDFVQMLKDAGFEGVSITPTYFDEQTIRAAASESCCSESQDRTPKVVIGDGPDAQTFTLDELGVSVETLRKSIFSARITAIKPG